MLQITPQHHLMLAVQPIDFRRGIDGLMSVCKQHLKHDPFSGAFFIFTNKRRTTVKILIYDGLGFWLIIRRFSLGKLVWWPTETATTYELTATELQILLAQGMPHAACIPDDWRPLKPLAAGAARSVLAAQGSLGKSKETIA
jgi:transposase